MPQDRFKLIPAVYLILQRKPGEALLSLRQNTGYADGMYSLVSGHVDGNEPARAALCREAKEEAGITLIPENLDLRLTLHRLSFDSERIDLFFSASHWQGEIVNTEPHKCGGLSFFPLDDLPNHTVPYIRSSLLAIAQEVNYLEYGWQGECPPNL